MYNRNVNLIATLDQAHLLNSIIIQVILSAPNPSDVAKFMGHILSIISSTILDSVSMEVPLLSGDFDPILPVGLFTGEEEPFLPLELVVVEDTVDLLEGEVPPTPAAC